MPRLAVANPRQVEQVYRESYDLWGAGLSRQDYLALWNELSRTDWAAKHARFHVWVDEEGRHVMGDSLLVLLNSHDQAQTFIVPTERPGCRWEPVFDTARVRDALRIIAPTGTYRVSGRSMAAFRLVSPDDAIRSVPT